MAGRHRPPRMSRGKRGSVAFGLVAALFAGTLGLSHLVGSTASGCTGGLNLDVAVAPDIAPSVTTAAAQWERTAHPAVSGTCVHVVVTAESPAITVNSFAANAGSGVVLGGGDAPQLPVASASPGSPTASAAPGPKRSAPPAVWIPDSTAWLDTVSRTNSGAFDGTASSLASSPIVIATTKANAAKFGMTGGSIGVKDLTKLVRTMRLGDLTDQFGPFQLGVSDVRYDAAGLAGAMLITAFDGGKQPVPFDHKGTALVADFQMNYQAAQRATNPQSLFDAFISKNPTFVNQSAAFASEQALIAFDASHPAVQLEPVTVDGLAALDYPVAVISDSSQGILAAARMFQTAIVGPAFRTITASAGFRGPDGSTGANFPAAHSVGASATINPIDISQSGQTIGVWVAAVAPASVLTLLDVSNTMGWHVQNGVGPTRMQVTQQSIAAGLQLFTVGSVVGSWEFGPGVGKDGYAQMVAPATLGTDGKTMNKLVGAAMSATPGPVAGCRLLPALEAAYKQMKAAYTGGGGINTIVVFTDCASPVPGGPSVSDVATGLQSLADATKPIPLVLINVGDPSNMAQLKQITDAVGGAAGQLTSPSDILKIFLEGLLSVGSATS